jgi:hypothetical protein
MRTIAYVDGYNLYHGRLKPSPFKWLDMPGLLSSILRVQSPCAELTVVKLFTASIKARYARRGQTSVILTWRPQSNSSGAIARKRRWASSCLAPRS